MRFFGFFFSLFIISFSCWAQSPAPKDPVLAEDPIPIGAPPKGEDVTGGGEASTAQKELESNRPPNNLPSTQSDGSGGDEVSLKNSDNSDGDEASDGAPLEELPSWVCRVDTPPAEAGGFTVGETFVLLCEGETVEFGSGKIHFQMPEPLLYAIKVLSVDRVKPNELILTVTSYFKGNHDLKGLVVVEDLVEKFKVAPLVLKVRSVIKDPKQKPFGPAGAIKLSYPKWLWIGLVVFFGLLFFYGFFRFYRRGQKLRVLERLKVHNTALGSYSQLNKDLRSLSRDFVFSKHKKWSPENTVTYIERLDESFRLYLLREFIVPATDWKTSLVLKEIQKNDKKRFRQYGAALARYLKELDRAKRALESLKMEDCQQLTQLARRTSQTVWQVRKQAVDKGRSK